ncbi:MAG: DUF2069 domain-containing protein [Gammaproteobacteria bacterium]|nr:DUF2069 domain-containing protein [Gammaproteobacteria bacterium]
MLKTISRISALAALGILLILMLIQSIGNDHPVQRMVMLLCLALPLTLPLRGLLHARAYTFAWCSFLSLYYFTVGVMWAFPNTPARMIGIMTVLSSVILFISCLVFIKANKTLTPVVPESVSQTE